MDDFADAPVSVTEHRAEKASNASIWSPRDLLVRLLRELDSGELEANVVVVFHGNIKDETGTTSFGYANASPNLAAAIGVAHLGMGMMVKD